MVAVDWGVLKMPSSLTIEQRLFQLYSHMLSMVSMWQPDAVAVEEPFIGRGERQYVSPAFAIGQAQAVVLIAAAGQAIPVYRYSPAQVKRAVTDYGAATKGQVQGDGEDGIRPGVDTLPLRRCGCPRHRYVPSAAERGRRYPWQGDDEARTVRYLA